MSFDRESVNVVLGQVANRLRLDYADITSLPIGGRGDFVTTSGGGWRGGAVFSADMGGQPYNPMAGIDGAAKAIFESVVISTVLNKLTTIKKHHIETIVHLEWVSGSITLLNTTLPPTQWAALLAPVIQRIETAHQDAVLADATKRDMAADEKVCPYCAETIKAAAIKCRYCGSNL